MKTVTRKQLVEMGATKYQADLVTKPLTPIRKQGSTNVYDLFAMSDRCKKLIENTRAKATTRNAIQSLRWAILSLAEQIQDAPFGMSGLEQLQYTETLNLRAENLFAETKAKVERLKKANSTTSARGQKS